MKIGYLVLTLVLMAPLTAFGEVDCTVISPEGVTKYEGECKNNLAHGNGAAWLPTRLTPDGYYQGYFVNGKLHGRAKYLFAGGTQSSSEEWFYKGTHPWRKHVDGYARDFVLHLKADPDWRGKIEKAKTGLLADPRLDSYLEGLWDEAKARILDDINHQDSDLSGHLSDLAMKLGNKLAVDHTLNNWVNERILAEIPPMVEKHRDSIANFITKQIDQWSKEEMTDRIELAIGRDLQFIRINGTLVGGLVGLVIYSTTVFLKG